METKFRKGQLVRDLNGRVAKVAKIWWSYAYTLEGDPSDRYLQEDEIEAVRAKKRPGPKVSRES